MKKFNVMLAFNYFEKPEYLPDGTDFIITKKLDGVRCVLVNDDRPIFYSRQGKIITGLYQIEQEIAVLPKGYIYDGELLLDNKDQNIKSEDLYRKTVSVVSTDGPKEDVIFNCFDMIPIGEFNEGKSTTSAEIRKAAIHELINTNQFHYFVEVPVLYKGKDKKQITYWLNKITSEGGEGIMLNLSNGFYECKRSKQILKVKKFKTADVKVVDLYEGTGRNTGKLGGITVEFEFNGSTYQCNVGSGFTDQERINYWTNKGILLGQIVEIQYFEISSNLNGKHSMRFPIWIGRIRNEKSEISMN